MGLGSMKHLVWREALGVPVGGGRSASSLNVSASSAQVVTGSYPNAWGLRKEVASAKESVSAPWSAPDAESKLAHASALEKVTSGRWHSKQIHSQMDVESPASSEPSERPKLKLLPRSKPLENLEQSIDYKQVNQHPSNPFRIEKSADAYPSIDPIKNGIVEPERS
ncbi:hypothetical protein HAX54_015615 [Datura stramonium]|uniref:Uncharacterized protein n=1 Tax=Datura stramonium TaxID=4076 RepID=A0ABS8RGZ8_DATST|nr:hypothetical protein [Datura stramonium]